MITYGLVFLVIGAILWVAGAILAPRPPSGVLVVVGQVCLAIGAVVLIIGLVLLVLHSSGDADLGIDSLGILLAA